ncbi:MAG: diguanylate cyclase [Gammaproteobacteria bacterium]|nr:diguanylate cyclase [Gammaproteobacteria bacterium]
MMALAAVSAAQPPASADPGGDAPVHLSVQVLGGPAAGATEASIIAGTRDADFGPFQPAGSRQLAGPVWLRIVPPAPPADPAALPVLIVRSGLDQQVDLFARRAGAGVPLGLTSALPKFGGAEDKVFALPAGLDPGQPLYARVQRTGRSVTDLDFSAWSLSRVLAQAASHARIIAFAFGALMAMALSTLLVRFILSDHIYALYGTLFSLQAIYLAYFSGQGFHWPVLSALRPFANYAYNVPVAVSAAAAALFVREFANLKSYSRRIYQAFGWLALAFLGLAAANVLRIFGLGKPIAELGNLMFLASAVFTLVVAFLAWRGGGNRAAGWFLIAWSLLCTFQIVIAFRLLYSRADSAEGLLYYGLAPSMVAAAVLVALGVSDHVRVQSAKLSEAERRAQIDPLTGVLNRRSLIEQLDSACMRALARSLPVSVLFLDLDHFKQINDTYGHAAGDACLAAIIPAIQAELRQSDTVGRYGGEEFVVILYGADAAAAHPIAERICRRVAQLRIENFPSSIQLTCSIGVAASDRLGVWGQHLIAHADTAVYAAKRSGRNQVQLAAALAA